MSRANTRRHAPCRTARPCGSYPFSVFSPWLPSRRLRFRLRLISRLRLPGFCRTANGSISRPSPAGGRATKTPIGDFAILEKDREHRSTPYGRLVAADGSILKADADYATPVPEGAKFERAPMKWFVRFSGPVGMHAGRLPGYAASHGCVRLPVDRARLFYDIVTRGAPARVSGSTPHRDQKSVSAATTPVPVTPPPKSSLAKGRFFWFRRSTNSDKRTRLGENSEPRKFAR